MVDPVTREWTDEYHSLVNDPRPSIIDWVGLSIRFPVPLWGVMICLLYAVTAAAIIGWVGGK